MIVGKFIFVLVSGRHLCVISFLPRSCFPALMTNKQHVTNHALEKNNRNFKVQINGRHKSTDFNDNKPGQDTKQHVFYTLETWWDN